MPSTPMSVLPTGVCVPPLPSNSAVVDRCDWSGQLFGRLRNLHAACGVQHRLDDIVIAGAAADVAFELVADGRLVDFTAMAMHDIDRRHDHARGAIAALQAVIVTECCLHRM